MEGLFVADIAKNSFTGRHTASGAIVMSYGRIAEHYLKSSDAGAWPSATAAST